MTYTTNPELEKAFDVCGATKHSAIFNEEKLNWINSEHLRHLPENKYEENLSSPFRDETEAMHLYNMSAENNYAELRTSALSPIYNSPDDFNTDLMQTTLMLTRPCLNRS